MFCPACGQSNRDGNRFCQSCGKPLATPGLVGPVIADPPYGPRVVSTVDFRRYLPFAVIAVVLVVVIAAASIGYSTWHHAQQQSAYDQGAKAQAVGDWEGAVSDYQTAGSYLDAPSQLAQAQAQVERVLPLYTQAQDERQKAQWWSAAHNLAQVVAIAPKFRDAAAQLAAARSKIGYLVYTTNLGGQQSLRVAPADGSTSSEVATSNKVTVSGSPAADASSMLVKADGAKQQTLYLTKGDGSDRRELATANDVSLDDLRPDGPGLGYSADGRYVAFTVDDGGSTQTDYVADALTATRHQVAQYSTQTGGTSVLDFTPNLDKALVVTAAPNGSSQQVTFSVMDVASGSAKNVIQGQWINLDHFGDRLSPDGARVLALLAPQLSTTQGITATLVDVPTGKQLGLGNAQDAQGVFSPDGQKLLLARLPANRTTWEMVLVDVLHGTQNVVGDSFARPVQMFFLPGTNLAIIDTAASNNSEQLYILDATKGAIQQLLSNVALGAVKYDQAAGRLFVFEREANRSAGSLLAVDPLTLNKTTLASASDANVVGDAGGKRLVVDATNGSSPNSTTETLTMMGPDGSNPQRIATAPYIGTAALSPDGQQIAYTTAASNNSTGTIYVANTDGTGQPVEVATGSLDGWVAPASAGAATTSTVSGK